MDEYNKTMMTRYYTAAAYYGAEPGVYVIGGIDRRFVRGYLADGENGEPEIDVLGLPPESELNVAEWRQIALRENRPIVYALPLNAAGEIFGMDALEGPADLIAIVKPGNVIEIKNRDGREIPKWYTDLAAIL